jgi:hypothetical protein
MLPVILARVGKLSAAFLGMDLHYLADAVPVLVICLGLAFLPVTGEERPYRAALPRRLPIAAALIVVICCFLVGSFWSETTYQEGVSAGSASVSSYIATAEAAIKQATTQLPGGAVIATSPLPASVMDPALLGKAAWTAPVIGPLIPRGSGLAFVGQQPATARPVLMFDNLGRLLPAVDVGATTVPPKSDKGCWRVSSQAASVRVYAPYNWIWVAKVVYTGAATTLQFTYDGITHNVAAPGGTDDVYFPASGTGSTAYISGLTPGLSGCVSSVTMGNLNPSPTAYPMPFYAVR